MFLDVPRTTQSVACNPGQPSITRQPQSVFDIRASREPTTRPLYSTTRRPRSLYNIFALPADKATCSRITLWLQCRAVTAQSAVSIVYLMSQVLFGFPANPRRVRRARDASAARSAAPADFITFLGFPRTRLRVLVLFGFPANPRHVRRAPHASAARSAGPAIFITFLGFPRTRLRVLGYVLQNRTLGASMACGGGAQRCLQRLFDVRVSRELNDAPFAFPTRRRRAATPPNLFFTFLVVLRRVAPYSSPIRLAANPRRVRRAPHTSPTRTAAAAVFITFLGFPQTWLHVTESHSAFSVYSMSESPASLTTRPSRSRRVGGAQRCPRIYSCIFGGPATRSAVLKSYSASREPKTRPARSAAPTIFITFLGVSRTRLRVTACGGRAQRCLWFLFNVRASREPNDASVALPRCRQRVAPPPRNFYYIFEGPADHLTCRVIARRPFYEKSMYWRPANPDTRALRPPRFLNYVFGLATNRRVTARPLTRRRCLHLVHRLPANPKTHTAGLSRKFYLDFWRSRDAPSRRDALAVAAAASHRSGILNFGFGLPVSAAIFLFWIWYSREQGLALRRAINAPPPSRHQRARHSNSGFRVPASGVRLRWCNPRDFNFGFGLPAASTRRAAIFLSCLSSKPPSAFKFWISSPRERHHRAGAAPIFHFLDFAFPRVRFTLPPAAIAPSHR
ncbi:hypothetical protein DFH09DRAFT_1452400 [Mycena vulgaris]|nr:hypothetical protein DFH09DRAFT_1452400 [Mycena vulgaris]